MNIDPLIIRIGIDDQKHKLLIINQPHLRRVMREFAAYHNSARYQGIDQQLPVPQTTPVGSGPVLCRNVSVASSTTTTMKPCKLQSPRD